MPVDQKEFNVKVFIKLGANEWASPE